MEGHRKRFFFFYPDIPDIKDVYSGIEYDLEVTGSEADGKALKCYGRKEILFKMTWI